MLKDLTPLLSNLPPKTAAAFTQAVARCSEQLGIGPDWVRRWISFTVVADALASYAPDGSSVFELKGGAAIEMRMRQLGRPRSDGTRDTRNDVRPRATKDLDATYRGAMDDLETALRAALALPRHRFSFRVESETPDAPFMRRFRIRVAYREERFGRVTERSFSSVKLEMSIYEGTHLQPELVTAFSLRPFGLDGPERLPCIPLTKQIAQKLHAVTEVPPEGKTNDRFRDLLDIVMLSTHVPSSVELRAVCEETFRIRNKQNWPPEIVTYPHWIEPMEQMADEMGLEHRSAKAIAVHIAGYVRQIASAR